MRNFPVDPVADRRSRPHKILYNRQSISAAATDFKPIASRLHLDRGGVRIIPWTSSHCRLGFHQHSDRDLSARANDFTDNVSLPFGPLSEHFGYVRISAG
jgi:hypothetical protein